MHRIIQKLKMGWLLPLLLALSTALPFAAAAPAYAACPKGEVAITGGCKNTSTGDITCDSGYDKAYYGSSLTCVPKGTSAPTPTASGGSGGGACTTGGANDKNCYLNSGQCSTSDATVGNCTDPAVSGNDGTGVQCTASSCNLIQKYIDPLVQLLSALVGVAVTISIIIGGIQYGSSAGDPQATTAAKSRIRNSLIALVAFLFLYAFLQFLIPGGLFNRS